MAGIHFDHTQNTRKAYNQQDIQNAPLKDHTQYQKCTLLMSRDGFGRISVCQFLGVD